MDKPKKVFVGVILIVFILFIVGLLTSCEPLPPIVDERCMDYTTYEFYQIERDTALGTQDQWILKTPHGDIEISDKTYEGAMNYEYSEICYERSDAKATTYLFTKKAVDIKPEPEVIYEEVEVEVQIEVPVPTVSILKDTPEAFTQTIPAVLYPFEDVAWVIFPLLDEYVSGVEPDPLDETVMIPWTSENFEEGDYVIITYVYDDNILSTDNVWRAQLSHYRNGIILNTYTEEENFVAVEEGSLEEYIQNIFDGYPEDLIDDARELHNIIYGGN